jgi:L-ascorbate metabolism protein UlaG (beta-lactamase superfamily)
VSLRYLGTAGWEIVDQNTTILVDPYLSRINLIGYSTTDKIPKSELNRDRGDDRRKEYSRDDRFNPDTPVIDAHIASADFIFMTHTHFDHAADVPYIAKKTGAKVIGTESLANLLRASGIPDEQIITVKGGEDYSFGEFSFRAIPSLHSALRQKQYFSSEMIPADVEVPLMIKEYVEGGTLMFLLRLKKDVLVMGGMNFIENEIRGLKPDVLLAGAGNSRKEIHNYTERLLSLTSYPDVVFPTHWDNFKTPYEASQAKAAEANATPFIEEVKAFSPGTKTPLPQHLEPIQLGDLR